MVTLENKTLIDGHAGVMLLKDGTSVNYGVIRIENHKLVYYTGLGLRELWSPNMTTQQQSKALELRELSEQQKIDKGYIQIIPLDKISRVLF